MSNPVIFKDLPATFPEKDKYRKPSVVSSVLFHVFLVTALVVVPLMFPRHIDQWQLMTMLTAPPPPPPAAPPVPVELEAVASKPVVTKVAPVVAIEPGALISPVVVPKDIAHIIDEPGEASIGVVGGVTGGIPGGIPGGVLGGILSANARAEMAAPPPPPPPPPPAAPAVRSPLRVGGAVREPQLIKFTQPMYPALALKARVSGLVVLEATLTEQGTVEEIRVISGHPLLVSAAIDCVKKWTYEPTYLNGVAVPVILTAKVNFRSPVTQ